MISVLAQIATQAPRPFFVPEIRCLPSSRRSASRQWRSAPVSASLPMAEFAAALTQYLRKSRGHADQSRTGGQKKPRPSAGGPSRREPSGTRE